MEPLTMKVAAVIAAAGMGTRMGSGVSKQNVLIGGKSVLTHALERLCASGVLSSCVVVVPVGQLDLFRALIQQVENLYDIPIQCVEGGGNRTASVRKGLDALDSSVDLVLIHDGARPFVTLESILASVEKAKETGAAVAAVPAKDTIKIVDGSGIVESTPDRSRLFQIQTPQVFRLDWLLDAHKAASAEGWEATDDSALIERMGHAVHLVRGSYFNLKITTPEDLVLAEAILAAIRNE